MPRCICNESCYWKWAASRLVRIGLNTKGLPKARENRGEKGNSKMPATPTMCMKTKGRISARWAYPTMLMKTRHLILLCHDVDDKKSVGQCAEVKSKATKRTRGARQRKGRFRPAPPEFRWSSSKDMPAPNGQKRPSRRKGSAEKGVRYLFSHPALSREKPDGGVRPHLSGSL